MPSNIARAGTAGASQSPASSAGRFLALVMQPLSSEVLHDCAYSRILRHDREEEWGRVKATVKLYGATERYFSAMENYYVRVEGGQFLDEKSRELENRRLNFLDKERQAIVALIRTPVPNSSALAYKGRIAAQGYLPISAEEIASCIAADEAFLRANPIIRTGSRRSI